MQSVIAPRWNAGIARITGLFDWHAVSYVMVVQAYEVRESQRHWKQQNELDRQKCSTVRKTIRAPGLHNPSGSQTL
jgi:hypothetical protein